MSDDNATDWFISRSHAVRALGYLSADLAQRALLPADYELPDMLDVFERGLVAASEPAPPKEQRGWQNASPQEILEARVQSLEEGLEHLKSCLMWALEQTAQRDGSPVRPEAVLDEEWSK